MEGRLVDMTWPLSEDSVSWPSVCAMKRTVLKDPDSSEPPGARSKQAFELNGGTGTHIDAPAHFVPGGRTVEQLQLTELRAPLAVVDIQAACEADGDYAATVEDLQRHESQHGRIRDGSLVCLRTGWCGRYHSRERYYNATDSGDVHPYYKLPRMHFPGFSIAAAEWLVRERGVAGVGVDTLSPDPGATEGFGVHHALLGADKYILENLDLSGDLPPAGAVAVCAPAKISGAPEAPCRVFAVCEER
eukprot:TRINITY_DN42934_c0_g1_i1.p2 TRINITY_DN42934_c0_g1~~TRINITY_DN42934_c0_g1_i1.p2  ORF type:complete len:269 (+),score=70.74 TRINITY_DN42934_c0_g1_i1:71-808(+)